MTPPVAKSLTYDRTAQELVVAGEATGGTMRYALGGATSAPGAEDFGASVPVGTNAGTYYVWYKVVGDAGHYDTDVVGPIEVSIAPIVEKVTVSIVGHTETVNYDGNEHVVSGYDVASSNALYLAEDITFGGTAEARRKEVVEGEDADGTTEMGLSADKFTNANANFEDVEFVVTDGWVKIQDKTERVPNRSRRTKPWVPTGV